VEGADFEPAGVDRFSSSRLRLAAPEARETQRTWRSCRTVRVYILIACFPSGSGIRCIRSLRFHSGTDRSSPHQVKHFATSQSERIARLPRRTWLSYFIALVFLEIGSVQSDTKSLVIKSGIAPFGMVGNSAVANPSDDQRPPDNRSSSGGISKYHFRSVSVFQDRTLAIKRRVFAPFRTNHRP